MKRKIPVTSLPEQSQKTVSGKVFFLLSENAAGTFEFLLKAKVRYKEPHPNQVVGLTKNVEWLSTCKVVKA